jgi:serine/threonine protein kinase
MGLDPRCSLADMVLSAGTNIGPYRIIEPVGRGGMASVFKAYEASLDRYVALKVLPPEFLHDPTFAERFRREAQTIAKLEHPQIIPIFAYDIDAATGTPWMSMRLISGGSLSQRIKRGRLMPSESARILKDVADALDYAHRQGVIHRDVKPQNVLLDDSGRVYLADFGIAKIVESSAHMTQTGMITGTPQYMAPEQALGKSIDKTIDIYALGIVAYELFTGRVPFSADTPVAVLMKQASEPMPLPPVSEVQEDVTRAILRATAKDPVARWPSATAFAQAIVNATTNAASSAAVDATSDMPALSEETVQQMTVPNNVAVAAAPSRTIANTRNVPSPKPAVSTRTPGAGVGVAAALVFGLALMTALAGYLGYRYYASAGTTVATASNPAANTAAPTPESRVTPAPLVAPEQTFAATPAPEASPSATPQNSGPVQETHGPAGPVPPGRERLTPAERRAILGPGPPNRRERLEAMAEARRRIAGQGPEGRAPIPADRPAAAPMPTRTRVNLEVEASQPSTGAQIGALYGEVLVDGKSFKTFVIRFSGANSFARWKKIENVSVDGVPLSAREITVAVATDPNLNDERMEGSTRVSLEGEETSLSVAVRFYNQFDKSVRFR